MCNNLGQQMKGFAVAQTLDARDAKLRSLNLRLNFGLRGPKFARPFPEQSVEAWHKMTQKYCDLYTP